MPIFCPRHRMMRGPARRAMGIYGGRGCILSRYFDLVTGSCSVSAQSVNSSAFNAIQASAWAWTSHDKVCTALNTVAVSGGGLVASGAGYGTLVTPMPNVSPLVCLAYLADAPLPTVSS